MTNKIYLHIAGFLIGINFHKLEHEKTRNSAIQMVESFTHEFQILPSIRHIKADYIIDIKRTPTAGYLFLDESRNAHIKLFRALKNLNRITTFYSVSTHQFQLILMQVIFWLLADKGFIIHCSAVKINNGVLIFIGRSGTGKSTIAELLSDKYEILADDCGIIKKIEGQYYFYQAPAHEKNENIIKIDKHFLIKAIFLLKKSSIYKLERIVDKEMIFKKLCRQLMFANRRDIKQKTEFIFKMTYKFSYFYLLDFGKDKIRLKHLIENAHF